MPNVITHPLKITKINFKRLNCYRKFSFDYVRIPRFPGDKQAEIARLYHHDVAQPAEKPRLDSFVDWHNRWNTELGIWELDREMKALQGTLSEVQEQIIEGKTVKVPLNGE